MHERSTGRSQRLLHKREAIWNKNQEGSREQQARILFKQILISKLWILDDWGVVTMPRDVSEEIFDLFVEVRIWSA